ncbi:hypothetical protein AXG93_2097s1000 [Marchantia polymorpha subsp. ruderalis]|uniref:Uncharacterized protein n=1 Tax=Marchantia polymorpha subsp. ruderalis TaxID=1480154 RepID=A0A176W2U9_MARPO|nr:hypothetical protein AXG93_2097s1000 [Marchantia polymorpha subsp. ruderalis]
MPPTLKPTIETMRKMGSLDLSDEELQYIWFIKNSVRKSWIFCTDTSKVTRSSSSGGLAGTPSRGMVHGAFPYKKPAKNSNSGLGLGLSFVSDEDGACLWTMQAEEPNIVDYKTKGLCGDGKEPTQAGRIQSLR